VSSWARAGWVRREVDPRITALAGGIEDPWRYTKIVDDGVLQVLVSPNPEGYHMSIAHLLIDGRGKASPGRYPTWEEIKEARYFFCPAKATMAMLLPPKDEYVNFHETAFHLWEVPELADRTDRAAAVMKEQP
jgi:hypothetical protein